jgi:hypothetical protein
MSNFICYNFMSKNSDHCLDLPNDIYQQHGVSRQNFNDLDLENLKDGDIIFVKMDFLVNGYFANNILPKIDKKFVLVTGVSDFSLDVSGEYLKVLSNPYLLKWFTTNPPHEPHEKIEFIPIGFQEYERLGDKVEIIKKFHTQNIDFYNKKDKIFIPYHSNTNGARRNMILQLSQLDIVEVGVEKLDFESYLNKISEYKFVLSLRGNGWDCHRHYEILLTGSIPVIENGPIRKNFDYLSLPHYNLDFVGNQMFKEQFDFDKVKDFLLQDYHLDRIKNATK